MRFGTFSRWTLIAMSMMGAAISFAGAPADYYKNLDGKSSTELQSAIKAMADGHVVVKYGADTWTAFETTDVREIRGRKAWFDMYSNNLVWLPEHAAMNIEHSVAKSWWKDATDEPYTDLFHLNPSDQNSNNKKSNLPPGKVAKAHILDTDVFRIGQAAEGYGGGSASVFEPADEYKGDFARAYFYIYTTYGDKTWSESYRYVYDATNQLKDWAVNMLLEWNRIDPVDSKEMSRNDAVNALQGNRNAFIDHPELAEYLWGTHKSEVYNLASHAEATPIDRPAAPWYEGARLTGVNTYAQRFSSSMIPQIRDEEDGQLYVSLDGAEFSDGGICIDGPVMDGETHVVKAYVRKFVPEYGDYLRGNIATLKLAALNPDKSDWSQARWTKVAETSEIVNGEKYIILSSNTLHVMSTCGGTSATAFLESGGFVGFNGATVTELPIDAAIVEFADADDSQKRIIIEDIYGNELGSWYASAKNKMKVDKSLYTPGTASISDSGNFIFTFSQWGSLQFNKTQPRFLNYESAQTPVYLYKFKDFKGGLSEVESIEDKPEHWGVGVNGNNILAPAGAKVFDLNGRCVSGSGLCPGVYIVAGSSRSCKVIIK